MDVKEIFWICGDIKYFKIIGGFKINNKFYLQLLGDKLLVLPRIHDLFWQFYWILDVKGLLPCKIEKLEIPWLRLVNIKVTYFKGETLSSTIVEPSSPSIPK